MRKPDEVPEREGGEPFLSRWSRKKDEARQQPPEPVRGKVPDPGEPAPELPPVDKLTKDSDYRDFFHPKVGEDTRRLALKKLFSDPHFNVMDGLDVYIDDYSKSEPIPPEMLAGLRQAQNILRWAKEDTDEREREEMQRKQASAQAIEPPAPPSVPEPGIQVGTPEAAPAIPDGPDGQMKS